MVHVEKIFSKNYGFRKIWKEKKKTYNNIFWGSLPQTNSWVIKINQSIYHYEILSCLTCRFQVNVLLLNSLKISVNQRFRFSDVFKGYRHDNGPLNEFWKKNFALGVFFVFCFLLIKTESLREKFPNTDQK